ncbi:phosphomevalonate kinase [Malassezia pachydermatis]
MTLVQKTDANPFVALALLYSLHVALEFHGVELALQKLQGGMDVVIAGDNDYYSHRIDGKAPTFEQLSALPPFSPHSSTLGDVHKTGLGSSAAMTTSLVAALLLHLEVAKLDTSSSESTITTESLVLIHNVAQLAHCAAQGKVGSGFDVSASVWGSQLYRRFDPALIKDVMRTETGHRICTPDQSRPALRSSLSLLPVLGSSNPLWIPVAPADSTPTAVEGLQSLLKSPQTSSSRPSPLLLPPGVRMCLADVDTGSNTRTLVGKVSDWRAKDRVWADQLYKIIAASNQSVADGLLHLHLMYAMNQSAYIDAVTTLATMPSSEWDAHCQANPNDTLQAFIQVRNSMRSVRAGMRELGTRSGAPVEPPEMTRLLDTTIQQAHGLIGGGVPGAGGYDALFLLFLDPTVFHTSSPAPSRAPAEVCAIWQAYTELSVGPLLCGADEPARRVTPSGNTASSSEAMMHVAHALAQAPAGLRVPSPASVRGLQPFIDLLA